jgi:hypothetical protein
MLKLPNKFMWAIAGAAVASFLAVTPLVAATPDDEAEFDENLNDLFPGVTQATATPEQLAAAAKQSIIELNTPGGTVGSVSAGGLVEVAITANPGAQDFTPLILISSAEALEDSVQAAEITTSAFNTLNLGASAYNDTVDVTSALTGALMAGASESADDAAEYQLMAAAITRAAVVEAKGLVGPTLISTYNPKKNKAKLRPQVGAAGVVTGAVATVYDDAIIGGEAAIISEIVKAATKASRDDVFAIVQAAVTASLRTGGEANKGLIVNAAYSSLKKKDQTKEMKKDLKAVAKYAVQNPSLNGAGAKGVAFYDPNNMPVTNITGF